MVFLKVFQQCGAAPGQGFRVTRTAGVPRTPWVPFQPHPTGSGWCRRVISEEHQEFLQSEENANEELSEGLLEVGSRPAHGAACAGPLPFPMGGTGLAPGKPLSEVVLVQTTAPNTLTLAVLEGRDGCWLPACSGSQAQPRRCPRAVLHQPLPTPVLCFCSALWQRKLLSGSARVSALLIRRRWLSAL